MSDSTTWLAKRLTKRCESLKPYHLDDLMPCQPVSFTDPDSLQVVYSFILKVKPKKYFIRKDWKRFCFFYTI